MRVEAFHARVQLRHPAVRDRSHRNVLEFLRIYGFRSARTFCTGEVGQQQINVATAVRLIAQFDPAAIRVTKTVPNVVLHGRE